MNSTPSYWCYRCTRFVIISPQSPLTCPRCSTGFIESINPTHSDPTRSPFPTSLDPTRRTRRRPRSPSPFNPVIVLRNSETPAVEDSRTFHLFYDDASGSGLRPVPAPMSEFLMGSGFDRLLDQLSTLNLADPTRPDNPPASKSSIESLPKIRIDHRHVSAESHCAVCKDPFETGSEAREMPCQHIYHEDCILPWLSLRNTCPVCRHVLPGSDPEELAEPPVGLTIWRLPGGGFAVGRFAGGRRERGGVERELPAVYTEVDGGFGDGGVAWGPRRESRRRNGRGIFSRFLSLFGRDRTGSDAGSSGPSISRSGSGSVFGRLGRRRSRGWVLEDGNGISRW